LLISKRVDEIGPLETRQLYEYGLGVMESGDVMFQFIYGTTVFAINLSRPPATEYIVGFNLINSFALRSRWNEFRERAMAILPR